MKKGSEKAAETNSLAILEKLLKHLRHQKFYGKIQLVFEKGKIISCNQVADRKLK